MSDVQLYCGDCLETLPALEAKAVFTDPPYNIGARYSEVDGDNRPDYWAWVLKVVMECRKIAPIVAFTHKVKALQHFTDWDWIGVWNKPYSSGCRMGNSPIVPHWEPIFLYGIHSIGVHTDAVFDVFTHNPAGKGQVNGNHGRQAAQKAVEGHRFTKPVALYVDLIEAFTQPGDTILDPFLGSGTTGVACIQTGRNFIGIEIDENYFNIAKQRIEAAQTEMVQAQMTL